MEKLLTSHQAAKLLNVWPHTIRRWEKEGKLKPLRTPGGHRRYKESQIMALIGEEANETGLRRCAVYARVSTAKQAEAGNLQRQKERLITYAVEKDYQVKAIYAEIASGLDENRRELAKLVQKYIKKKERFPELSNWKQWSSIKKAAVSAIKKLTKQEVKSLVSWQHYRRQLITG